MEATHSPWVSTKSGVVESVESVVVREGDVCGVVQQQSQDVIPFLRDRIVKGCVAFRVLETAGTTGFLLRTDSRTSFFFPFFSFFKNRLSRTKGLSFHKSGYCTIVFASRDRERLINNETRVKRNIRVLERKKYYFSRNRIQIGINIYIVRINAKTLFHMCVYIYIYSIYLSQ